MTISTTQLLGSATTTLPSFVFHGLNYQLSHPDQAAKARLETLIVANERQAIDDMFENGFITADEKMNQFRELAQLIRLREHAPGGSIWVKYMQSSGRQKVVGLALFHLSLLIVCEEGKPKRFGTIDDLPKAIEMFADAQLLPVFAEVVPDFFAWTLAQKTNASAEMQAELKAKMSQFYSDVITKLSATTSPL